MRTISTAKTEIQRPPIIDPDFKPELNKLSDFAFVFLFATAGDTAAAERLLDDFIDLVFEGGSMSTWRYRILLRQIREGL